MRTWLRLPNWLGDVVAALPVVDALRERGDALTLAAPWAHAGWLAERAPEASLQALAGPARARDAQGHDLALLLDGSWRSARAAWWAGVPRRVGFARGGRGPLLTDPVTPARERGAPPPGVGRPGRAPRWLPRPFGSAAVELAGLAGVPVARRTPLLLPSAATREAVEGRLESLGVRGAFVLANVGARPGSAKGWPLASWEALLRPLRDEVGLLLTCGPGEEGPTRALAEALDAPALLDPVASVLELAALGARAAVCVAADGGARHVLRAGGARTVTLIGPTDPRHTAEHLRADVRLRHEVDCGPCHLERCPLPVDPHACMTGIDVARAIEAVRGALGDAARA